MALSAATVFEVRTAGNDTNGGGFVTGSTGFDYSQQDSKNVATGTDDSTTDLVTNGTTTVTSATANFGTTIVGNIVWIEGGTGAVVGRRYQVISRTNATTIVLDKATGLTAGTGATINVGGAILSPAVIFSSTLTTPVAGMQVWIKAGTYTISSASTNIANGCISSSVGMRIEGYQTTRGDLGTPPLLQASGISTFVMVTLNANSTERIRNVSVDGAGLTSSRGFNLQGFYKGYNLSAINCTNSAYASNIASQTRVFFCIASGCTTQVAFSDISAYGCVAHSNTVTGFQNSVTGGATVDKCIAYNNSGATSDGFFTNTNSVLYTNCVAYNNGRDGFRISSAANNCNFYNCIAQGHAAGWGWTHVSNSHFIMFNCAGFDNNSGNVNPGINDQFLNENFVTGAASFFTNPGAGDFSLNNSGGGGADAKAAGIPGVFPGGLTTGFLDIGAAQHADAGGGGGEHSSVF